ncbi:MAG: Flp pilus assembly complex ATPase component TadA [Clostridia bacterium]|nr:Flp pilus assembly complex ATPase component TadA [Clostridia bacterium]
MLKDYLDRDIYNLIIKNFSFNDITEIRMRINEKLIIAIKNKKYYLKKENNEFIIINKYILDNFIKKISENSLYAFNENIINGYITLPKGIRVGLCGTVVMNEDKVVTIKEFQSVNVRIPHTIRNCSIPAYDFLVDGEVKNTLIVSAPGCGKTTFLRDFIYQLSVRSESKNILVADERNEICASNNGEISQYIGGFCDVYTNCSKTFAFKNGIRSMSPDVIITDEIDFDKDVNSLLEAMNCGVNVVATIHAKDINQLKRKNGFEKIINNKIFSRFVVLTNDEGPGTLTNIYDEKLNSLYCKI